MPAHIGIADNEKAACPEKQAVELAGNGLKSSLAALSQATTLACKRIINSEIKERWEHKWLHEAHGRIYRKWHGLEISQQALLMYEDLQKAINTVMIQLRTGKIGLKSYLYGIKAVETGDCRCVQDLQIVRHMIL